MKYFSAALFLSCLTFVAGVIPASSQSVVNANRPTDAAGKPLASQAMQNCAPLPVVLFGSTPTILASTDAVAKPSSPDRAENTWITASSAPDKSAAAPGSADITIENQASLKTDANVKVDVDQSSSAQDARTVAFAQAAPPAASATQLITDGNTVIAAGEAATATPTSSPSSNPSTTASANQPKAPTSLPHYLAKGVMQVLERNFGMPGYNPPESPPLLRTAPPAPLDGVFPSSEFLGTWGPAPMGVNDSNYAQYPLEQALWKACPLLKKERIRVYGWLNPGLNASTSRYSNYPVSYIVAANKVHWDQVVARIERVPDTVQHDHPDWGFRLTNLYGEDYRFTTAKGWFSTQLLNHNQLTGYDPVEAYVDLYTPKLFGHKIFDGIVWRCGRYVSCPDIEAQLAPDNYLFTHTLMFTFDTYTQTGVQSWIQLNKYFNLMTGLCAGSDNAPWTNSAIITPQVQLRYVSRSNKDSLLLCVNELNGSGFRNPTSYNPPGSQGKDNLQQANVNWTHVWNRRFHTTTEWYYLWTYDALKGGTVSNGPIRSFGGGGGPGVYLPGNSQAIGMTNYSLFRVSAKDYLCLRPLDILYDPRGWRSGYPGTFESWTLGWCHRFSDTLCIRPEIRLDHSYGAPAYNNGQKKNQFMFACDLIQRF